MKHEHPLLPTFYTDDDIPFTTEDLPNHMLIAYELLGLPEDNYDPNVTLKELESHCVELYTYRKIGSKEKHSVYRRIGWQKRGMS